MFKYAKRLQYPINIKKKDISENEKIVSFASEYWADAIMNAGKGQINYQMGNGMIELSENDIEALNKNGKFKPLFEFLIPGLGNNTLQIPLIWQKIK